MPKDPHAAALGRKGGKARMEKLSAEERRKLARDAGRRSGEIRRKKAAERKKKAKQKAMRQRKIDDGGPWLVRDE
jgi:hypothetical protein